MSNTSSVLNAILEFRDVVLGSTGTDLQGDYFGKAHFESIVKSLPAKLPIWQNHNPRLPSVGFFTNFKIVKDKDEEDKWLLCADALVSPDSGMTREQVEKLGISRSATGVFASNSNNPEASIFLPFPHYKDEPFIRDLLSQPDSVKVGAWLKKGLDSDTQNVLLQILIPIVLTPVWERIFDSKVYPLLSRLWDKISRDGKLKGFVLTLTCRLENGESFEVLLVPSESGGGKSREEIRFGLSLVKRLADRYYREEGRSYKRIRAYFDESLERYVPVDIQYLNGDCVTVIDHRVSS